MKTTPLNLIWFFKNITSIRFRHWYGTLLLVLVCFGMSARGQGAGTLASFQIGDRVRTISQSAIFLAPPFAGHFVTTESIGVHGTVTEGPARSADVWWWKVRFDDGVDGWVAERQIRNGNGQAAAPRINSSVEVIPSPNRQNASGEFVNLNPPNGATVTSQRIVLRGTVTDDVYALWLISFSINGSPVPLDLAGNFSLQVNLQQGANNFSCGRASRIHASKSIRLQRISMVRLFMVPMRDALLPCARFKAAL